MDLFFVLYIEIAKIVNVPYCVKSGEPFSVMSCISRIFKDGVVFWGTLLVVVERDWTESANESRVSFNEYIPRVCRICFH